MKTLLFFIGLTGFFLMGNDPVNTSAALMDWDGFPEINIIGLILFAGSMLIARKGAQIKK